MQEGGDQEEKQETKETRRGLLPRVAGLRPAEQGEEIHGCKPLSDDGGLHPRISSPCPARSAARQQPSS